MGACNFHSSSGWLRLLYFHYLVSSIKMEWFACLLDSKEVNVLHEPYFQILRMYVSYSRFHVSSMVMYYIIAPSAVVMDVACSK